MKTSKSNKYYSALMYWSTECIKRGHNLMAPVPLKMETKNLLKETLKYVNREIYKINMLMYQNIIKEQDYSRLKKLNIIKTYLINRKKILKIGTQV